MSCTSLELRQRRAKLVHDARALKNVADGEKRSLTAEESASLKKMLADMDAVVTQITEAETREGEEVLTEAEQREMEEQLEEQERSLKQPGKRKTQPSKPGRTGPPADGEKRSHRASKEYEKAFGSFLRNGLQGIPQAEMRAIMADSDVDGGYLAAPQRMLDQVLQKLDDALIVMSLATVIPVSNIESIGVPTIESDPDDADWTSELSSGDEDTAMAFGKRELNPHHLAKRIKISGKLLKRAANAEGIVTARLSRKFGETLEKAFMTGNGASQPLGVFVASSSGISVARDYSTDMLATSLTFDGLVGAKYNLKQGYRDSDACRWLFHPNAVKQILTLKDGEGRYIWQPSVVAATPDRLLNIPVFESAFAPNTFTSGQYVGMLADFSYYWIAMAEQMELQRLMELYAATNQVGLIGRLYADGMPTLEEAFCRIKLG